MPVLLSVFGELEEFIADDLYPYRYVITPLLVLAGVAAAYVAYRVGAHLYLWKHRLTSTVVGVPLLVVSLVAGNYLLSPLWERSFLEEESPLAAQQAPEGPSTVAGSTGKATSSEYGYDSSGGQAASGQQTSSFQPRVASSGEFRGADDFHFGRGDAQIIETAPGTYVLRFENFSVRNGPDLFVYLSEDANGRRVSETLNLGGLKATDGAFNYEIPASVDLSKVRSAVVWCKQFGVLFAHAELKMN
jgi:hypothetical protein